MIKTKLVEELNKTTKLAYLAKYLNSYISEVISKFTNNKELVEKVIEDKTLMYMIITYIDQEEEQARDIFRYLDNPFESTYISTTGNHAELGHILYDLIIKD